MKKNIDFNGKGLVTWHQLLQIQQFSFQTTFMYTWFHNLYMITLSNPLSCFASGMDCPALTSWMSWEVPEDQTAACICVCAAKETMNAYERISANSEEPYKSILHFQTISNISYLYVISVNIHMLRQWRLCTVRQPITFTIQIILIIHLWIHTSC